MNRHAEEIIAILEAGGCLLAGKSEKALAIVKRMDAALVPNAPKALPASESQNPKFSMQEWAAHARTHRWRFDLDSPVEGATAGAALSTAKSGEHGATDGGTGE